MGEACGGLLVFALGSLPSRSEMAEEKDHFLFIGFGLCCPSAVVVVEAGETDVTGELWMIGVESVAAVADAGPGEGAYEWSTMG